MDIWPCWLPVLPRQLPVLNVGGIHPSPVRFITSHARVNSRSFVSMSLFTSVACLLELGNVERNPDGVCFLF